MITSASVLCCNMFFDHNNVQRGPTVLESRQELMSESLTEDIYAPSLQNDEMWKKCAIPTPPYSPETYTGQTNKTHMFNHHHQNLQVVPDDFPEDLSSDLPMVLSDAEMERLTSSALGNNDFVWSEPDLTEPNSIPAMRPSIIDNVRESPIYAQKHYRDFHPYPQQLPIQENCMNQQHSPQNWSPYSEGNPSQGISCIRPPLQQDEFAPPRYDSVNTSCKRTRKPRRGSRNSPQRQETPENEDSEDSEISRATHNVLERQRREDLKCRFQLLRDCIPELEENERAPKVAILKKSREYVHQLILEEQRLCADKELERQRRLILLERLHMLRNGYPMI
ncbi:myc proto-oncogene protein isoform X2 [Exaiptasia diaphana]|uniref:BHLH domain-containing protein n=1 Tax=Exaiptasia diaphana TaxID=2652724 RepID=A0A913Y4D3_EXADI|nr:myc proto-oncogene protein isoform X2 [Exaiptasia diaphana]